MRSKIVKNEQRRLIVARYAERRAQLKEIIRSPPSTPSARRAALAESARQPRDASAVRVRNRDAVDGRPRGHLRSSVCPGFAYAKLALDGQLPGIQTASW